MTTKKIVYPNPNGGVIVVTPDVGFRYLGEDENSWLNRVVNKDVPGGVLWVIVDSSVLPNRTFRDAWVDSPAGIQIDIVKARQIHKGRLLAALQREEKKLKKAQDRADRANDNQEVNRLKNELKKLDNLPVEDLTRFTTPDTLNNYWPTELGERFNVL